MTPKKQRQNDKRAERAKRNDSAKVLKRFLRNEALIELGKTVVTVPADEATGRPESYDFPATPKGPRLRGYQALVGNNLNPPHLSFLSGKTAANAGYDRSTRPGEPQLHAAAIVEDANRPKVAETVPVPVVPIDAAEEASKL